MSLMFLFQFQFQFQFQFHSDCCRSNRNPLLSIVYFIIDCCESIMNPIVGFIGCGNMAQAILRGLVRSCVTPASNIHVYDRNERSRNIARDIGCNVHKNNVDVAKAANVLMVCVKPKDLEGALTEIASPAGTNTVIASVAAGVRISTIEKCLEKNARVMRIMPNTPCLLREGASSITGNKFATEEDVKVVDHIMSALGTCVQVEEHLVDAVSGLSGSGPAYVYMMIEALADGGVLCGLHRDDAMKLATQTLIGSARMVEESGKHPGQLKDEVCSPSGSTIRAVRSLEEQGLRSSLINAVVASKERCEELGKKDC
eukprot:m.102751 g.102751  ORF g.102751 m.102751 type:complete len:314 (-) comp12600_c0_seq6:402-1343(-)